MCTWRAEAASWPPPFDTLELPENVTAPMEPNGRTVAHTKCVILDVLTLDGLATAQTVESGSKPHTDRLGEHEGQLTRVNPLANQSAQRASRTETRSAWRPSPHPNARC